MFPVQSCMQPDGDHNINQLIELFEKNIDSFFIILISVFISLKDFMSATVPDSTDLLDQTLYLASRIYDDPETPPISLDLFSACAIGNYGCVQEAINSGQNINTRNRGTQMYQIDSYRSRSQSLCTCTCRMFLKPLYLQLPYR